MDVRVTYTEEEILEVVKKMFTDRFGPIPKDYKCSVSHPSYSDKYIFEAYPETPAVPDESGESEWK